MYQAATTTYIQRRRLGVVHIERRGLQSRSDIQDAKVLKVYAFVARQPVAAAAPPPKFCPGQLLPPRLARRVAACSLFVQQAVYIVFLCMCGATAAAAALYNYTLMCIIVEKSGHTHYTVHTIIFVLLQVQDCIPFICTHMQGQRSSNIKYFSLVLKFGLSEKHTKICAIFLMVWTFTK